MLRIVLDVYTVLMLIGGLFFLAAGTIGLIRLPDLFTRMHATSKCDTMGIGMVLLGIVPRLSNLADVTKILSILVFLWVISPTTAHTVARAARAHGVKPVKGTFWIDRSGGHVGEREEDEG